MDGKHPEKYAPKKVFVLENNSYIEISYEELCERAKLNKEYMTKLFLPLHGMLMEVTENVYREFYREERRQQYLDKLAEEHCVISYDRLTTDEFNGQAFLPDRGLSVVDLVEQSLMKEALVNGLKQLDAEERELLRLAYFEEMTERAIAVQYGISQVAVNKKKRKVLEKLKKMIKR